MRRRQYWGCFSCKNRKNDSSLQRCEICKEPRDRGRYVVQSKGNFLLCKVHLATRIPKITVLDLQGNGNQYSLIMQTTEFSVRDCVLATIANEENNMFSIDAIIGGKDPELSKSQESPMKQSIAKSLYGQVLENAANTVYDSNIGRYVPKDTIVPGDHIKSSLLYAEQLKCAEAEKKRAVRDIVNANLPRPSLHFHNNERDIRIVLAHIQKEKKMNCSCCQQLFPKSALSVLVTKKSVENFYSSRGVTWPEEIRRVTVSGPAMHTDVRVCLFCYQFFDDGRYSDAIASIVDLSKKVDDVLFNSPLKSSQQQQLEAGMFGREDGQRPLSAVAVKVAMTKLRQKHDLVEMKLRFQHIEEKGIRKGGILDQDRFGRYLRDKYSDVKAILKETRKNKNKELPRRNSLPAIKAPDANASEGNSVDNSSANLPSVVVDNFVSELPHKIAEEIKPEIEKEADKQQLDSKVSSVFVTDDTPIIIAEAAVKAESVDSNVPAATATATGQPLQPRKLLKVKSAVAKKTPLVVFLTAAVAPEGPEAPPSAAPLGLSEESAKRIELVSIRQKKQKQLQESKLSESPRQSQPQPLPQQQYQQQPRQPDASANIVAAATEVSIPLETDTKQSSQPPSQQHHPSHEKQKQDSKAKPKQIPKQSSCLHKGPGRSKRSNAASGKPPAFDVIELATESVVVDADVAVESQAISSEAAVVTAPKPSVSKQKQGNSSKSSNVKAGRSSQLTAKSSSTKPPIHPANSDRPKPHVSKSNVSHKAVHRVVQASTAKAVSSSTEIQSKEAVAIKAAETEVAINKVNGFFGDEEENNDYEDDFETEYDNEEFDDFDGDDEKQLADPAVANDNEIQFDNSVGWVAVDLTPITDGNNFDFLPSRFGQRSSTAGKSKAKFSISDYFDDVNNRMQLCDDSLSSARKVSTASSCKSPQKLRATPGKSASVRYFEMMDDENNIIDTTNPAEMSGTFNFA